MISPGLVRPVPHIAPARSAVMSQQLLHPVKCFCGNDAVVFAFVLVSPYDGLFRRRRRWSGTGTGWSS